MIRPIVPLCVFLFAAQQAVSGPAFLIRFGADGRADVDWSGSLSAPRSRLAAWQFGAGDELNGNSWKCATRREVYWDTPYERAMGPTSHREKVTAKGVLLELEGPAAGDIEVVTRQGSFSFKTDLAVGAAPLSFLDGRVTVAAAVSSTGLTSGPDAEDFPSMIEARDGTVWVAYQAYAEGGDQIFVQTLARGAWSPAEPLAKPGGDYFRTAIAQDRAGRVWVVWAAQVGSNFDLYARSSDGRSWSPAERLTTAENSDIFHSMVADASGNLYLAYQSARGGNFDIYMRVFDGRKWSPEIQVSSDAASDWEPALASAADGRVTILWDTYARGSYDVVGRTYSNGKLGDIFAVAATGAFESRVSAQYDRAGRLWMAWDEGDWNWGKDYGYRIGENGRGLLVRRQARVAVIENGELRQTAAPIADAVPEDLRQVFQHPAIVLDGAGNPWVFFRSRVNLPQNKGRGPFRALWRLQATMHRAGRWAPMIEFPRGNGRIDLASCAVVRRDGGLAVVWATDGRGWPTGRPAEQDLQFASIPAGPPAAPGSLVAFTPPSDNQAVSHPREARDVERVRGYRAKTGDLAWRIVRGDIHRHTDLSWDGNRDGSLDDSYRYALDAAGFDFLGVCDHQAGESIPYNWWRTQKAVDLYTVRGRFAPVYSYERSLSYPNGHRNVVFGQRGRPILEIEAAEARGEEGAAKLYAYLRRFAGVTTSHTSASGMGTDWRDNDPELEPVVEIYQGYRSNFETLGAPRSPTAKESARFSPGFVWNAWAKGYKLGVQASSDHVSTHISYAGFYVDRVDRDAIVAAMKARRSFAATDNIFVDLRMGGRLMGESFEARAQEPLTVYVSGTAPIARVDVIKNNRIAYTAPGGTSELRFSYSDQDPTPGESYYYVRAEQADGQLCWSSPVWVRRQR